MKYLSLLAVSFYALSAQAGGIWFQELPNKYIGKHPITGALVTLEWADQSTASLNVGTLLGKADVLKKVFVSRNDFEAVHDLRKDKEDGESIARVVTTGDCQIVAGLVLVFPSGMTIPMKATRK